jgi:hypothetical protein
MKALIPHTPVPAFDEIARHNWSPLLLNDDYGPIDVVAPILPEDCETAQTENTYDSNVLVEPTLDIFDGKQAAEVVDSIFDVVEQRPNFNFLFLTENPGTADNRRFPDNAWIGTSVSGMNDLMKVTSLKRVKARVRFIICNIGDEELVFDKSHLKKIGWVIIRSATPESKPPAKRILEMMMKAVDSKCRVFLADPTLLREFPSIKPSSEDEKKSTLATTTNQEERFRADDDGQDRRYPPMHCDYEL